VRDNRLWYTDGQKAVSVADMDDFLDFLVDRNGAERGEIDESLAMRKVAFVYRCVRLIADAVRAAPWRISTIGGDEDFDSSADYQNKLGFWPNPRRTMELVTRSLLGPGSAYLFKTEQGVTFTDLRYMVASTIEPQIDGAEGLVGFKRKVNGKERYFDADRFVYFWPADAAVELGPPQSSPVRAALMSAGANYYTAKFISDFFARGAIKGTLLAVKGNPVEAERNRLKQWFRNTFFGGSETAWGTEIINADSVEPVKIGEGLESLNNTELTKQVREDIAVAMGVPMSKLLSSSVSGLGGGGVVESDDIGFYQDTVVPVAEFITEVLNEQLLKPLGYQWTWLWNSLDIFQQDEKARAQAFQTYVDSRMRPEVAAYMLGIEIPDPGDIPAHYVDSFEEKQAPPTFEPGGGGDDEDDDTESVPPQLANDEDDEEMEAQAVDLDKWERMASKRFDEGSPEKAIGFESDAIPANLKAGIRMALGHCDDSDDVEAMFGRVRAAREWRKARELVNA
jgi:phage portal protein BeeE